MSEPAAHLVERVTPSLFGFRFGEDVPMSSANLNGGLVALKDDKMILLVRASATLTGVRRDPAGLLDCASPGGA